MSRQGNTTSTPFWRTTRTLTVLFWCGVALAPLAALLLLVGSGEGTTRMALVLGLGSVVLIGLSVTWRRDPESVAADLSDAMADLEEQTHEALAQLRGQLRQIAAESGRVPPQRRREPEPRPVPHRPQPPMDRYPDPHAEPATGGRRRPEPEPAGHHHRPDPYDPPPQRPEREPHREQHTDPPRRPERDPYREPHHEPPPPPRRSEDYRPPSPAEQQRRRQAALEETGEMVRVTESVSVTRRETTTMRPLDPGYEPPHPAEEPGVYQGRPVRSGISEKFSRFKLPKMGGREPGGPDDDAQADSLLSGLAPEPGHEDDWYRDSGAGQPVPRQRDRSRQHDDDWGGGPREAGGHGGWRTEERSAELRMGMRESRSVPEDGWDDQRGSRYRDEPPRRAIADSEAEPGRRWSEESRGAGSYMDRYYGDR